MGAESADISVTLASDLQLQNVHVCPYVHTQPQRFQLYRPFSIYWHLSLHLLDRVFFQSRNYDIMELSDLVKCDLQSGVWMNAITKTKTKNNIAKSMSLLFFRALYQSKNHVIPHTVIAVILDIILNISKHRKQQQLQIQPLLKTIKKLSEKSK